MPPKVWLAIKIVKRVGWKHEETTGSHRQFEHDDRPGKVTIAGRRGVTMKIGAWRSVVAQAGLPKWIIRNYHLWKRL